MEPLRLEMKPMAIGEEPRKGYIFTFRYPNMHAYKLEFDFCQALSCYTENTLHAVIAGE